MNYAKFKIKKKEMKNWSFRMLKKYKFILYLDATILN
jgi:hypothetical protein